MGLFGKKQTGPPASSARSGTASSGNPNHASEGKRGFGQATNPNGPSGNGWEATNTSGASSGHASERSDRSGWSYGGDAGHNGNDASADLWRPRSGSASDDWNE